VQTFEHIDPLCISVNNLSLSARPQAPTQNLCPYASKNNRYAGPALRSSLFKMYSVEHSRHLTALVWNTWNSASSALTAWDFSQNLGNLGVDLGFCHSIL